MRPKSAPKTIPIMAACASMCLLAVPEREAAPFGFEAEVILDVEPVEEGVDSVQFEEPIATRSSVAFGSICHRWNWELS